MEKDSKQYEKEMGRDVLIVSVVGLIILLALVLWGIKIILEGGL